MVKKTFIILIFILLFIPFLSFSDKAFKVIYQNRKYQKLINYLQDDLYYIFSKDREIRTEYQRRYPFYSRINRIPLKEGLLIYRSRRFIAFRYIHKKQKINKIIRLSRN